MQAAIVSLLLLSSVAYATSTVPLKPAQQAKQRAANPSCAVAARFVEARPEREHVVWVFDRIASARAGECKGIQGRFPVWIWEGSLSALTRAPAYPVYLTEPERGAELD